MSNLSIPADDVGRKQGPVRNPYRFGQRSSEYNPAPAWIAGGFFLVGIALTALASDALFHDLAAFFDIGIACSLFVITWHSRSSGHDSFFLFLGVASFGIACMEALYVLAFRGAFLFLGRGDELAGQLWTMTRLLEAFALAAAPIAIGRHVHPIRLLLASCAAIALVIAGTILWPILPDSALAARGLLSTITVSSLAICLLCAVSVAMLAMQRKEFDSPTFFYLMACLGLKIFAQGFSLLVPDPAGWSAEIPYLAVMASTFLLYRAVVIFRWSDPSRIVVWENAQDGDGPRRTVVELRGLSDLIPICMSCKKIRTSDGEWEQIEVYVSERAHVEFSHGICPECAEKVYDDIVRGAQG
jgi:predicted membrane channel-forming protein YqfA (hemolysin III family)